MARAFGSYPECRWFESDRRYQRDSAPHTRDALFLCVLCTDFWQKTLNLDFVIDPGAEFLHKIGTLFIIAGLQV